MKVPQTWNRFNSYGVIDFFTSIYLIIPLLSTILLYSCNGSVFVGYERKVFVSLGTNTVRGLVAVTLTGLAILVSLSDRDFLVYFTNNGDLDALLFIFEYAVFLAVLSTVFGVFIQSIGFSDLSFYIFFFLFSHTLMTILSLVSALLRYADSKSNFSSIEDIEEEDVPDELKEKMEQIVSEAEDT